MLNEQELTALAADLESFRVERKESFKASAKSAIEEAICAFANDLPGAGKPGFLLIGVEDKTGQPASQFEVTDQLLLDITAIRSDGNILPFPLMSVHKAALAGRAIVVVEVRPSPDPPVRLRGRVCVRVGPRKGIATRDEERVLNERRRGWDGPFDQRAVVGSSLDELDAGYFQREYLPSAVASEVLRENQRSLPEQLSALHFASPDGVPNVAGMLVLGREPTTYLPGAYVQFLRIDGTELTDPIVDRKELAGSLPDVLRRMDEITNSHIHVATTVSGSSVEQRSPDYPIVAMQQLLRNAIIHRNYETSNAPVQWYWFADRIEIHSPGGLYGRASQQTFGMPGGNDYRNPTVAAALHVLGFVQRFGLARDSSCQEGLSRKRESGAGVPFWFLDVWSHSEGSSMTTYAFFNNKGGVGKTTLVYHVAHMMVDLGHRVLLLDLDPQSNLTAMCISEERLEELWPEASEHPLSILGSLRPILRGLGDIRNPHIETLREGLAIVPGDLGLSGFEDKLSDAWPRSLDRDEAAFRTLSAFHRVARLAAEDHGADIVLADVGPNLGAINRAALLAMEFVVTPLAPDLFSMQGLRNLGPTLLGWREGWGERLGRNPDATLLLPAGSMRPLGYVLMQAAMRLSRPVKAYARWVSKIPEAYHRIVLGDGVIPPSTDQDASCLGIMRHYQSLMPLAHDAQRPMFHLRPADGAIGAHMAAVQRCRDDFERLTRSILGRAKECALEATNAS